MEINGGLHIDENRREDAIIVRDSAARASVSDMWELSYRAISVASLRMCYMVN